MSNTNLFGDVISQHKPRQKKAFHDVIRSVSFDQEEIIQNILSLHCETPIELYPTYSVGGFYRGSIDPPRYKFDLKPQSPDVVQASSDKLPLPAESITTMMYDPPFMPSGYKENPSYKMVQRFGKIENMGRLFDMYYASMKEFYRILKTNGILIFKCQDCVDGRYNWMTHCEVMSMAVKIGFYPKDLFISFKKTAIIAMQNQNHARKFHCYFWVFQKKKCYIKYGTGGSYDYNEQPNKRRDRKKRGGKKNG